MKFPIYLDHNATTPCAPDVLETMLPWFSNHYGNPSSRHHAYGWLAEEAVEIAREQVASLIGAKPNEIIFTSGATEAANLGIRGVMEATREKGNHLITVATEHRAVLDTCRALERRGIESTYLPVQEDGLIDMGILESSIREDTVMIVVMMANNETGVIQPVDEIGHLAKKHRLVFMTDAVQAVGKIPVSAKNSGIDLMPISAHKMYGPKGVGALYINHAHPRLDLVSQMTGGGHEGGLRSGTLNVPGIVGFGKAAEISAGLMKTSNHYLSQLRDRLEKELLTIEGAQVNGSAAPRLHHVSNMSFAGVDGKSLLIAINKELAVSSGSACSSITTKSSHVLRAMGIADELGRSTLRFSLGRSTTQAQIDFAVRYTKDTMESLRLANKQAS